MPPKARGKRSLSEMCAAGPHELDDDYCDGYVRSDSDEDLFGDATSSSDERPARVTSAAVAATVAAATAAPAAAPAMATMAPATFMHGTSRLTTVLSVPHVRRGRSCPSSRGRHSNFYQRPELISWTGPGPLHIGAFATSGTGLFQWNDLTTIHTSSVHSVVLHNDEATLGAACQLIVYFRQAGNARRCAFSFPRDTHAESQQCAFDVMRALCSKDFVSRDKMGCDFAALTAKSTVYSAHVNKGFLYNGKEGDEHNHLNNNAFVVSYSANPNHMISTCNRNKNGHGGTLAIVVADLPNKPDAELLCWKGNQSRDGLTAPKNDYIDCDDIEQVVWLWQDPAGDTGIPVLRIKAKHPWHGTSTYRKFMWVTPNTLTDNALTSAGARQARVAACMAFVDTLRRVVPCAIYTEERQWRSGMGGGVWMPTDCALGDSQPPVDGYYLPGHYAGRGYLPGNLLEVPGRPRPREDSDKVIAAFDGWGPSSCHEDRFNKIIVTRVTEYHAWRAILWSNQTDYRARGHRKSSRAPVVYDPDDGARSGTAPAAAAAPAPAASSGASYSTAACPSSGTSASSVSRTTIAIASSVVWCASVRTWTLVRCSRSCCSEGGGPIHMSAHCGKRSRILATSS